MDTSNSRPTQGASGVMGDMTMESDYLKAHNLNKMIDDVKSHLPLSGHEELQELKKIAERLKQQHLQQLSQQRLLAPQNRLSSLQQQSQELTGNLQNSSFASQRQQVMMLRQFAQRNPMGQQTNAANMQQNPLIGRQNNYYDVLQPSQQLIDRLHQTNIQNMSSVQLNEQNKVSSLQQPSRPLMGQHNLFSSQQQQWLGYQFGNINMQTNQQNVMLHVQSQPGQQQVVMQQQPNILQRVMQQTLPTTCGFQPQSVLDNQTHLVPQQSDESEDSDSENLTAGSGNRTSGDWQEEVYQKIKAMKDLYIVDLSDLHEKFVSQLQQHDSLPQQPKNEQHDKLKLFKNVLERYIEFLQTPKDEILANYKDKLDTYEKQIINVINSNRRKPAVPRQQSTTNIFSIHRSSIT